MEKALSVNWGPLISINPVKHGLQNKSSWKEYSSSERCWKLADMKTDVSQVCRKGVGPAVRVRWSETMFLWGVCGLVCFSWCWGLWITKACERSLVAHAELSVARGPMRAQPQPPPALGTTWWSTGTMGWPTVCKGSPGELCDCLPCTGILTSSKGGQDRLRKRPWFKSITSKWLHGTHPLNLERKSYPGGYYSVGSVLDTVLSKLHVLSNLILQQLYQQ